MAATATERKLLIDGQWVETGEWVEVRSPYSGEVVGRVARGGAQEARRAIDAAARALESPLPAHKRAEILVKVAGLLGRRHEEIARTISDEAGKPIKAARVEASRAMSTFTFAAVEARRLAGEMVPMDAAPPGWVNVVVGSASEIGDVLVEDPRVKLITFTGSGTVGWNLAERAPRKRVKLELGNSTPVIVAADADLDAAADKLAANAFSFAGQSCISVQRIYVERAAVDPFLERFLPRVEALKLGDPADEETDVGPVIDDDARKRIVEWISESQGEILTGGDATDEGLIRPTVIRGASDTDKVSCEE